MTVNNFQTALKLILKEEGGYVHNCSDPGGATNRGITQATYDAYRRDKGLPSNPVLHIAFEEIEDIYYLQYWKACHCDEFEYPLGLVLFDTAVQFGIVGSSRFPGAVRLLQRALGVTQDGVLGPATKRAIDRFPGGQKAVAVALCDVRRQRRRERCKEDPRALTFLKGWLRRDIELQALVSKL